jgi:hypothetical protein
MPLLEVSTSRPTTQNWGEEKRVRARKSCFVTRPQVSSIRECLTRRRSPEPWEKNHAQVTLAVDLTTKQLERFVTRITWLFVVWFIR